MGQNSLEGQFQPSQYQPFTYTVSINSPKHAAVVHRYTDQLPNISTDSNYPTGETIHNNIILSSSSFKSLGAPTKTVLRLISLNRSSLFTLSSHPASPPTSLPLTPPSFPNPVLHAAAAKPLIANHPSRNRESSRHVSAVMVFAHRISSARGSAVVIACCTWSRAGVRRCAVILVIWAESESDGDGESGRRTGRIARRRAGWSGGSTLFAEVRRLTSVSGEAIRWRNELVAVE
jgi:hypothetical protein